MLGLVGCCYLLVWFIVCVCFVFGVVVYVDGGWVL